ncbi:hypothetical protein [Pannonibacter tanglangensis]|uniref:Uncharacterized protein n=1 Tax=Pannonibacter tanglangensis TaxID=2750084 RepID=A0ABW9ZI78_9HYPH|nr:hypothetical protein [Pannonibacter sp. XCT-34]NBN64134.1 hypothetical protein [Pannonibacter sp. XCT-34]
MTQTIDHILHFSTPDAVDLAALGITNDEQPVTLAALSARPMTGEFDGAPITVSRVNVIAQEAVMDDAGNELSPMLMVPGVWLAVRSDRLLTGLPELVAASDADRKARGEPFVLYVNPAYPLDSLRKRIEPQWMGSSYDLLGLTAADVVA